VKKVLHIIDQSSYAGVTTYAVRIVKNLPNYNHHIVSCYKGNAFDEISAMNIHCENLVNLEIVSYKLLLLKYYKVILFLSKNSFDIIHYHQGGIGVLLIAVVFRKKASVIHHLHGGNLIGDNIKHNISLLHSYLLKILSKYTHQVAVGNQVYNEYCKEIKRTTNLRLLTGNPSNITDRVIF